MPSANLHAQTMSDLEETLRNNFRSLANVYLSTDGLEIRDAFNDDVISVVWRPFDAKDFGVASFFGTYRSEKFDLRLMEEAYLTVWKYFFEFETIVR